MTRSTLMALFALGCAHAGNAPEPVAAPVASVTVGTPILEPTLFDETKSAGTIDLERVAEAVERDLDDLKRCYEGRLLADPELSGEVLIHWAISTEGEFEHGCITRDTVEDNELTACVNKLVADGKYPASKGQSVDVTFSFMFASAG